MLTGGETEDGAAADGEQQRGRVRDAARGRVQRREDDRAQAGQQSRLEAELAHACGV